jgi:hypothetical protein
MFFSLTLPHPPLSWLPSWSLSCTLALFPGLLPIFFYHSDEDYNVITRGRLLDRMRVAVAGSLATKMVLGEDTNFNIADIKRVRRMAERYVFYYGKGGEHRDKS